MPMIDQKDDKIIVVCANDLECKGYTDIKELSPHCLAEIRRFFEDCILSYKFITNNIDKKNENNEVAVDDFLPATKKAYEAIQHSV
ncbi:hypothetical protein RJ640_000681 [Escallonia rubra]|uniref:inorganic diphosphatase n=1 Tax=Escallonia rubra TaxID=112253 RepID=A0AA88UBG9_9ASTE|nr:hypothetical protein RJ640_000681 [Escallonia rubra]